MSSPDQVVGVRPPTSPGAQSSLPPIPPEIHALSDAELIDASRVLTRGYGSGVWFVVPAVTAAVGFTVGWRWAALSCIAAIVVCRVLIGLHERSAVVLRGRLAKRELNARYHVGGLALDEAAAATRLADTADLDTVILFRAWALPHGGHRFVQVELGADARISLRMTPFLGDLHQLASAQSRMLKLDRPLSAAEVQRVQGLLAQLTAAPPTALEPEIQDGLPCELIVLRRGQAPLRASMSFDGVTSPTHASPVARLIGLVLDLEAEVSGREITPL
ncbi:MAG: hypothetical protein ABW321_12530 [Polyangiales bacterium]